MEKYITTFHMLLNEFSDYVYTSEISDEDEGGFGIQLL